MLTKTRPVKVKAGPDSGLEEGQFEAIVSVFGNVDSDGDRVVKGAFSNTLAEWAKSGDPMPVIWTHDHRDAFSHIGVVVDAKETNDGLWVKGQLDIGPDDENPTAKQVYKLLKGGRVRNWSYAYDVVESEQEKDGTHALRELGLHEVGPTLVGSNRDTETLAVKSDKTKSNIVALNALLDNDPELVATLKSILRDDDDQRTPGDFRKALDEAAEQVARTQQALQDVLAKYGETEDDQAAASGAGPAKDDDQHGKSDEPSPQPSARVLAAHQQLALEGALYEHSD